MFTENILKKLNTATDIKLFSNFYEVTIGYGDTRKTILEFLAPSSKLTIITHIKIGFADTVVFPESSLNTNHSFQIFVNEKDIFASGQDFVGGQGNTIMQKPFVDLDIFYPVETENAKIKCDWYNVSALSGTWTQTKLRAYAEVTGYYYSVPNEVR